MKTTKGQGKRKAKDELVYVAGAMSGKPFFNFPLFDRAIEAVNAMEGKKAEAPADLNDPEIRKLALASPDGAVGTASPNGETWGDFLAEDVRLVADRVDSVALIPGWEESRGAKLESFVAFLCQKPVYLLTDDFKGMKRLGFVDYLRRLTGIAMREWARGERA